MLDFDQSTVSLCDNISLHANLVKDVRISPSLQSSAISSMGPHHAGVNDVVSIVQRRRRYFRERHNLQSTAQALCEYHSHLIFATTLTNDYNVDCDLVFCSLQPT